MSEDVCGDAYGVYFQFSLKKHKKGGSYMHQLTPPMGWNSWNTFGENISDQLIREVADCIVETGLLAAGYNYVVIDDCWAEKERDDNHCLVPDARKFPHGIKALADYVHGKGLKFGMYSCAGLRTCAGYPASFEYEFLDAQTFANWGIDFLKYDYCNKPQEAIGRLLYTRMGIALANTGRDILFSACSWGEDHTNEWIKSTGAHMWRSTGDINDSWASVKSLYEQQLQLQKFNGQGCFNDMDMLVVGMRGMGNVAVTGCSDEEYRTHFSLWAMLNSPLIIGCDVRTMDITTKEILTNPEIIAINQDVAARQPMLLFQDQGRYVWGKLLDDGDIAMGIFNLNDQASYMGNNAFLQLSSLGLNRGCGKSLAIRDLWSHEDVGVFQDAYFAQPVPAHGCRMFRCKVVDEV